MLSTPPQQDWVIPIVEPEKASRFIITKDRSTCWAVVVCTKTPTSIFMEMPAARIKVRGESEKDAFRQVSEQFVGHVQMSRKWN